MDKYEFLAGLGMPPEVIALLKAGEAGSGTAAVGAATAVASPTKTASPADSPTMQPAAANSTATAASARLPRPMAPDCKPVHGKVVGPDNHLLCATHGHVIDVKAKTVIANNLDEYKKLDLAHSQRAAAGPAHDPAWDNRPAKQVGSVQEMDEDLRRYEDGEAPDDEPVPMAVDGAAPKPRPAQKPAPPKKPSVVTFDKDEEAKPQNTGVVHGDARAFKDEVVNAMKHLGDRALIRADEFTLVVVNACLDFQAYAKPKIKEIEKAKERASELAGLLATGVIGICAGPLAGKVAEKIGEAVADKAAEEVAKKIGEGLKDLVVAQVKEIPKDGHDLDDAVERIAQGFRLYAGAVHTSVENHIVAYANDIQAKVASGKLKNEELKILQQFMEINDSTLDELLERKFGIPGPGRGKEIQLHIFREMVKQFEKLHLRAKAAMDFDDEGMASAFTDALKVADTAEAKLAEDMHNEETRGKRR